MNHLLTGGTGFLGSYVVDALLADPDVRLFLLTRASPEQFDQKLWRSLQLHMSPAKFRSVRDRLIPVTGDLTAPDLGLSGRDRDRLVGEADSVLHIAASLNRKSAKACLNANLRGTLSVVKLAQQIKGLKRFSHVSTVAVAGKRSHELVHEDTAIDWDRSDFDPYGRTKKFAEHMVRELLPDVPKLFLRPSIVMGDSRKVETTQFDMVLATHVLGQLPVIPADPRIRVDIVPADFVGQAIATLHARDQTEHEIYHLSSGEGSLTLADVARSLEPFGYPTHRFVPRLSRSFFNMVRAVDRVPSRHPVRLGAALLKVFWPYVTWDVVFDNRRVVAETGLSPAPFSTYGGPLLNWAAEHRFQFPHRPLPPVPASAQAA